MPDSNLDYEWAAGHDNPGGLVQVHKTTPTNDIPFCVVTSIGSYLAGVTKFRMSPRVFKSGFASTKWFLDYITRLQLKYIMTTFCNGGWSGYVTIKTRLPTLIDATSSEFGIYNATLIIKEPEASQNQWIMDIGKSAYTDFIIDFEHLELIA